jgi:hypothetical protein
MNSAFQRLVKATAHLPGVTESDSWGTPSLKVADKMLARMHEEPGVVVIRINLDQRQSFIDAQPDAYFVTDHYRKHLYVLGRLPNLTDDDLDVVLTDGWRNLAPARLRKLHPPPTN